MFPNGEAAKPYTKTISCKNRYFSFPLNNEIAQMVERNTIDKNEMMAKR